MWTSEDVSVPWYICSNHICLLEVIYTAAQDQHCNGKTDGRSITITADQCSVDNVCEGDQRTNADSGAIENVNGGNNVFKDLVQAGKAGLMCVHVYSNH